MSPNPHSKRVAILQSKDSGYCRSVIFGALKYIGVHQPNWCLQDAPPTLKAIQALKDWEPHAIIAHTVDPVFSMALLEVGIPIVSTSYTIPNYPTPIIDVDHEKVGAMAASYFLEFGFRNFAFFGSGRSLFSVHRELGFRNFLKNRDFTVNAFHTELLPLPEPAISWADLDQEVEDWLEALPKPVAILASNDCPARKLLELCHRMGLNVPSEVAILGVDNDESECRMATPNLSSIALPSEKVGYLAAETVHEVLNGTPPPNEFRKLDPLYCVTRQSTDAKASHDQIVTKALSIIRDNITQGISVEQLAERVGCSRRVVERKFKEQMHTSVLDQIHSCHIDVAKRLLSETEMAIGQVAEKCGLPNIRRFNIVFKKTVGSTPRDFRKQAKA